MVKSEEKLLFGSVILHHLYIVFLNTSSVHGLRVPDKRLWTAFLLIPLLILIAYYLRSPATTWYEKSLYMAITLATAGSFLRIFGISVQYISYSLVLVLISILITIPLMAHHHNQVRLMLFGLYLVEILLLISQLFDINQIVSILGPLVEVAIVLGILYYNYSMGFAFDELFIIIIVTLIGWYFGDFLYTLPVPSLIITTLFEQTLSLGQFSLIGGINPQFFLSLHMAEVFNILILQLMTRRSWNAMGIVIAGLDMTYPPLLAFRALFILVFLRKTVKTAPSKQMTTYPEDNPDSPLSTAETDNLESRAV